MKQKIAVIGGGRREQVVADMLRIRGFSVSTFAMESSYYKRESGIEDCLKDATALILPVRSNREDLMIDSSFDRYPVRISKDLLLSMKKGAPVYCGIASERLRKICKETEHPFYEIMEYDEVAIPNAVLTAEGTLIEIANHSEKSFKELSLAVLGYGRVGKACAELFSSVGCKVVVFCRNDTDIRHGREQGFDMRYYGGYASVLTKTDYLINTVPSLIVDENMLSVFNRKGMVFDLASMPGGVDVEYAKSLGIETKMLPGIPGKYAPITAGKILGSYYVKEMESMCGGEYRCD